MTRLVFASAIAGAVVVAMAGSPASAKSNAGVVGEGVNVPSAPAATAAMPAGEIQVAHGWHNNCRYRDGYGWHYHANGYTYHCQPYGGGGGGGGY
jgi:hypothetical protein